MKKALITGVTGQDGSYLSELLLEKGYKVDGLIRRSSTNTTSHLSSTLSHDNFDLVEGEISDSGSVYTIVNEGQYDEIYNLAAQSHVGTSFEQPTYTYQVNALGPLYLLDGIRRFSPHTRFYQASTSELFGKNYDTRNVWKNEVEYLKLPFDKRTINYQDENTQFKPQSPYAVGKLAAHETVRIFREGYGLHANAGILFNHESERRGENFVTRKITKWIGEFYNWTKGCKPAIPSNVEGWDFIHSDWGARFPKLRLGNIDACRDWGHAEDYVYAMWLMLQQEKPDDYVIATGETHSIRDFLQVAFNEIGIFNYEDYIVIDPKFYRPAEVEYLCGRADKAYAKLEWKSKVSFEQLVKRMVWSDINAEEETRQKEGLHEKELQKEE